MQPNVSITELDGALGILPATGTRPLSIVGTATAGPLETPASFARVEDVIATFTAGPLVELAVRTITTTQLPVQLTRVQTSEVGAFAENEDEEDVDVSDWTGTSVPTTSGTPHSLADVVLEVVTGGTRGTAGIVYRLSYDGGNHFGPQVGLGTDTSIALACGGSVALAAGTLVTGDTLRVYTTPPVPSTDYGDAFAAIRNNAQAIDLIAVANPISGAAFDAIETAVAAMFAAHRPVGWVGSFRVPILAPEESETEAEYATAFGAAFASKATNYGSVCAGAARIVSGVFANAIPRQPFAYVVAPMTAAVSAEVNIADVNLGPIPGASIYDEDGNPEQHDESVNPGLDAARACVARSIPRYQGVYVNRPLLLSAAGSDFDIMPKRRVINRAHEALYAYFVRVMNRPIRVSKSTGRILESEARRIEAGADNAMTAALGAAPMASGWSVRLSRTDVILSTKTLTVDARIVPLGYPETINVSLGFTNPALSTQQV